MGALLVLAITLAGFALVWPDFSRYIREQSGYAISEGIQEAQASQQMLSLVYWQESGGLIKLYLYNYGSYPFQVTRALVGGKLVAANGTVPPGKLEPVTVYGTGDSVVLLGNGGVEFDFYL